MQVERTASLAPEPHDRLIARFRVSDDQFFRFQNQTMLASDCSLALKQL